MRQNAPSCSRHEHSAVPPPSATGIEIGEIMDPFNPCARGSRHLSRRLETSPIEMKKLSG